MSTSKKSQSNKLSLTVTERLIVGKKVRKLRKEGFIPANIYGPDFSSKSVSIPYKDLITTYKTARETGIVYLTLGKEEIPTLIKHMQRHPLNDTILHVDFRKIDLKKKVQTAVPVKSMNVSEAVTQKGGVLLSIAQSLLVEALPENIPQSIDVDISVLKEVGQEIKVADLPKSTVYEIKDVLDKVVFSVVAHKEESVTPETATAAAPEVITEAKKEDETAQTEEQKPAPEEKK